jgi:hypothetical protein
MASDSENKYCYTLGLRTSLYNLLNIRYIMGNNIKEARNKWSNVTGEDIKESWLPDNQTVYNYSIMILFTNDLNIKEDDLYKENNTD